MSEPPQPPPDWDAELGDSNDPWESENRWAGLRKYSRFLVVCLVFFIAIELVHTITQGQLTHCATREGQT